MPLYLLLNILTILIPLVLSFDRRVHFYTYWRSFFPAMLITMLIFIIWDVVFTAQGVWAFNENYHSHIKMLGLPLEEYLFFITVPYASVFTVYVMAHYFPGFRLSDLWVRIISLVLIVSLIFIALVNINRAYTAVNFLISAIVIGIALIWRPDLLRQFYFSYLIILIPFGLINGILTGSFIEDQVVWYNNNENLGIRVGTIPVEDFFYGMTLILLNYFLTETFLARWQGIKQKSS
jgi:lycopene cyclase domain-containing protein